LSKKERILNSFSITEHACTPDVFQVFFRGSLTMEANHLLRKAFPPAQQNYCVLKIMLGSFNPLFDLVRIVHSQYSDFVDEWLHSVNSFPLWQPAIHGILIVTVAGTKPLFQSRLFHPKHKQVKKKGQQQSQRQY